MAPDRWWITFTGQTVVALSQVFVLSVPVRLAAVWFGPNELGSACSIGVFGNQVGPYSLKWIIISRVGPTAEHYVGYFYQSLTFFLPVAHLEPNTSNYLILTNYSLIDLRKFSEAQKPLITR